VLWWPRQGWQDPGGLQAHVLSHQQAVLWWPRQGWQDPGGLQAHVLSHQQAVLWWPRQGWQDPGGLQAHVLSHQQAVLWWPRQGWQDPGGLQAHVLEAVPCWPRHGWQDSGGLQAYVLSRQQAAWGDMLGAVIRLLHGDRNQRLRKADRRWPTRSAWPCWRVWAGERHVMPPVKGALGDGRRRPGTTLCGRCSTPQLSRGLRARGCILSGPWLAGSAEAMAWLGLWRQPSRSS
jgi:hypothetical protein